MNYLFIKRTIYWIIASILIAILLYKSFNSFLNAWFTALLFLPSIIVGKIILDRSRSQKGVKRILFYFYAAIGSLYLSYLAITFAFWYFLQLQSENLNEILMNPVFIWVVLGFFIVMEGLIIVVKQDTVAKTVSLYSNRKKTILEIDRIAYVESLGAFTKVYLLDETYYKNNTNISTWEKKLKGFLRVHRSFLINPGYATFHGSEIKVDGKWDIPVSRGYKKKVLEYYQS